jgi:molecular chaperone DnaK
VSLAAPIIGIDLGTSRSVAAFWRGSRVQIVQGQGASDSIPSVVALLEDGSTVVGEQAVNQRALRPERTIEGAKRFIGRRFESLADIERAYPYPLVRTDEGGIGILVGGKVVLPESIAAEVIRSLKFRAEEHLCESVTRAVITVPATFDLAQREATKRAARDAGLLVERIISEPVAAALAYGLEGKKSAKIAVFDLGGGTFNVSILDIGDGVFEVLGTSGDPQAGGEEITEALAKHIAREFRRISGLDLLGDTSAMQRIREVAEVVKIGLSSMQEVLAVVPSVIRVGGAWRELRVPITRSVFESVCGKVLGRLAPPCEQALADAKLKASDIDHVVLVGGSTRIPKVQELAKKIFQTDNLDKSINPDEVVAIGAAIQGGVLQGTVKGVVLLDATPVSLGVETPGGLMTRMIERNSIIPTSKKEVFSTATDNQTAVTVVVLQGERPLAVHNRVLGVLSLDGLAQVPRGVPQVEVEFALDANGILNVRATDKATGNTRAIAISGASDLSEEEVASCRRLAELQPICLDENEVDA